MILMVSMLSPIKYSQEKVVFVTCEDDEKIADLKNLSGKYVRFVIFDS